MMPAKANSLYKDKNSIPRTEPQPVIDLWQFRPRVGDYEGEGYELYPKATVDPLTKGKAFNDTRTEEDAADMQERGQQTYGGLKALEHEMQTGKNPAGSGVPPDTSSPKQISAELLMNALR